jgi:D-alanine-D-alanine ligase-like ATP-grasp enzyme
LNHLADGTIEEADDNKYVAIGFDKSGNLLEIMYNHINEQAVKVFHAMKCRKQFREDLGV